jgi:RES domain-containing protein
LKFCTACYTIVVLRGQARKWHKSRIMKQHPESARLLAATTRCLSSATHWSGVVYRSASVSYAAPDDLVAGLGGRIKGGRWTTIGGDAIVYCSLSLETALAETLSRCRHYGIPTEEATPCVFAAIRVDLEQVLDLTDGQIRRRLRVSKQRMVGEPWRDMQDRGKEAITQAIGRTAAQLGLEGILVPSAAQRAGVNLLIFPDNLRRASRLRIVHEKTLRPRKPN